MRKSLVHLVCQGPFVVLIGALVVGCQKADEYPVSGPLPPTEVRHDLDPLTKRFPAIGTPTSATWVTWNSATGGLAAPTTYWIDAVVTLAPATAAALVASHRPTDDGKRPTVQALLASNVPTGPFLTSASLDEALSTSGWRSSVYLDRNGNQLVISALDD